MFRKPGFTDLNKYQFMTGGLEVTESDQPDDWSHMLSAGSIDLQPNDSLTFAFAVLGGFDLEDLQNNVRAAREIYFSADPSPGLNLVCDPTYMHIAQGESEITTCTVSSVGGFEEQAELSCRLDAVHIECRFDPSPVNVPANGSVQSRVTLSVTSDAPLGYYDFVIDSVSDAASASHDFVVTVVAPEDKNLPPVINITAPQNTDTISGVVSIEALASNSDGTVDRVVFGLPNGEYETIDGPPYTVSWDSASVPDGMYGISATAFDELGEHSTETIDVEVNNGGSAPTSVRFLAPQDAEEVDKYSGKEEKP